MPNVPKGIIAKLIERRRKMLPGNAFWENQTFRDLQKHTGMNLSQWKRFVATGKMTVTGKCLAKMRVLTDAAPEHQATLLKAVEAKYAKGKQNPQHRQRKRAHKKRRRRV